MLEKGSRFRYGCSWSDVALIQVCWVEPAKHTTGHKNRCAGQHGV